MKYIWVFAGKILPFALFFILIYVPVRLLILKRPSDVGHELALLALGIFITAILSQTLTPDGRLSGFRFFLSDSEQYYNFVPFTALWRLFNYNSGGIEYFFVVNILGNILLFVPVGLFHRIAFSESLWHSLFFGLAFSGGIEIIQIFLPRTTDIDDLIMNTIGVVLGGLLGVAFESVVERFRKIAKEREKGRTH